MKIQNYSPDCKAVWDEFLTKCKNSHFFFNRDYMEYHANRFKDYSILISDESGKLIALLPANITGSTVYSHQGLTFGGLLFQEKMKTELMIDIFEGLKNYLRARNIKKLYYKPMPHIYHSKASEEDLYVLFREGATLEKREVTSVIDLNEPIKYSKGRKWAINKGKKAGLKISQSHDFHEFWLILSEVLAKNHQAMPAHTADEMEKLSLLFPSNIKLFCALNESSILAGALIYENAGIVHTQYMANSAIGRDLGALDLLIDNLIREEYSSKRYFDFGISTEDNGRTLNTGLISQKEGFGAHPVVHDLYSLEIAK